MRVNQENKSVDMEVRDINYILPAYVRSYMFYSKNEMPEKIVFPMFPSVLVQGKEIPIEYVAPDSPMAVEIKEDGKEVAEVTPEQEATLDEKDDRIKELKEEVLTPTPEDLIRQNEETIQQLEDETADAKLEVDTDIPEEVSPARAAFAEQEESGTGATAEEELGVLPEGLTEEEEQYEAARADQPAESESVPPTTPPPADRQPKQPIARDSGKLFRL